MWGGGFCPGNSCAQLEESKWNNLLKCLIKRKWDFKKSTCSDLKSVVFCFRKLHFGVLNQLDEKKGTVLSRTKEAGRRDSSPDEGC